MTANPFTDRDLTKILLFPTLSWSSVNAFMEYDRDKWYESYVLGNRGPSNPAMDAGRVIGERLATDPNYLPKVPRPEIYEQEFHGKLGDILLVGHLDGWSPSVPGIKEYKTTTNPDKWTQELVDCWGQITFYCLLAYLNEKIRPEDLDLTLTSIILRESGSFKLEPTGDIRTFSTKRTMKDILVFGGMLKDVHRQMEEFVKSKT